MKKSEKSVLYTRSRITIWRWRKKESKSAIEWIRSQPQKSITILHSFIRVLSMSVTIIIIIFIVLLFPNSMGISFTFTSSNHVIQFFFLCWARQAEISDASLSSLGGWLYNKERGHRSSIQSSCTIIIIGHVYLSWRRIRRRRRSLWLLYRFSRVSPKLNGTPLQLKLIWVTGQPIILHLTEWSPASKQHHVNDRKGSRRRRSRSI